MASVAWTLRALDELDAFCRRISEDDVLRANLFAREVFAVTDRLTDFPKSGRVVREYRREEIREVVVAPCRIIYRCENDLVEILAVWHGARLLDTFDPDR